MQQTKRQAIHCDESDLLANLRAQFEKGAQEVEVVHPREGSRIVTRADFIAIQRTLSASKGSPAERLIAQNTERRRMQAKFMAVIATADIRTVCPDEEMGVDAFGQSFDCEGMTFVNVVDYPPRINTVPLEMGVLIDEQGKRQAIRLVTHDDAMQDAMNTLQ